MIYNLTSIEKKKQNEADLDRLYALEQDLLKKRFFVYTNYPILNSSVMPFDDIRRFIVADCIARYKRLEFENVLFSIGYNDLDAKTKLASQQNALFMPEFMEKARNGYKEDIKRLDIGFDTEKEIAYSHADFITFSQTIFLMLYQKGYIEKKKRMVYHNTDATEVYQDFEVNQSISSLIATGEKVNQKEAEVYVLKLNKASNVLMNELSKIGSEIFANVKQAINIEEGIKTIFLTTLGASLTVDLFHSAYIYGIAFIVLRFDMPNLYDYIDPEEIAAIKEASSDSIMFTGNYAINPISKAKIPLFVANAFEDYIHIGIPSCFDADSNFASLIDIAFLPIVDYNNYQKVLINSSELNGLDLQQANKAVINYFLDNALGKIISRWSVDELIISSLSSCGVAIPLFVSGKKQAEYLLGDLPILYDTHANIFVKKGAVVRNNEKIMLNSLFLDGIASIAIRLRTKEGILPLTEVFGLQELEKFSNIDIAIFLKRDLVKNLLAIGAINYYLAHDFNLPISVLPKEIMIEDKLTDYQGKEFHKMHNNTVHLSEIIKAFSATTLRYHLLSKEKDDLVFQTIKMQAEALMIDNIIKLLLKPMEKNSNKKADLAITDFLEMVKKGYSNKNFSLVTKAINAFVERLLDNDVIYLYQAKALLSCLYPLCPSLAEELYANSFHTTNHLTYLGMPW